MVVVWRNLSSSRTLNKGRRQAREGLKNPRATRRSTVTTLMPSASAACLRFKANACKGTSCWPSRHTFGLDEKTSFIKIKKLQIRFCRSIRRGRDHVRRRGGYDGRACAHPVPCIALGIFMISVLRRSYCVMPSTGSRSTSALSAVKQVRFFAY